MPQAVAVWVAGAFASGAAAVSVAAYTFVYYAAYVVATVAINAGLAALAKSLSGKPSQVEGAGIADGRLVTVRSTVAYRTMVYGQVQGGGVVVFYGTGGTGNEHLWFVVAYAAHQCESLNAFRLDARGVPDSSIGGDGAVVFEDFNGYLNVWKSLGAHNVTVHAELLAAFPDLGSNFRGAGIAYAVFRLKRGESAWPAGAPRDFLALIKGKRLYNPSLDSTNGGSGSHRYADATTWAWSDNWALCMRDYLTGGSVYYSTATPVNLLGVKVANTKIDDAYTITAYNTGNEDVLIPPASPTTQQKRYTCNVMLSAGNTHLENLEVMQSAGAGHLSYTNGKYRIIAGDFLTPTITITDDDCVGKVTVSTHPKGDEFYNTVTGTFVDEDRNWQAVNFPTVTKASYKTDDGKELLRSIDLLATRTSYRCQRIAIIHLKQSRQFVAVEFEMLTPKATQIAEWETFMVTLAERGWTNKIFRCISKSYRPDGFIAITARDESAVAYDDPAVADYLAPDEASGGIIQLENPPAPTNFVAGAAYNGINFSWSPPSVFSVSGVVELWEYTSSTPFSSATKLWEGTASAKWITKADTTQRYYWVRTRIGDGSVSPTEPVNSGLPGKAAAVPAALNATASPGSIYLATSGATGTTASASVAASGGTGPYTYAWTWASGGTSITTTSATSNATTWSVSGMASAEVRSGTARCTVTDAVSATATVDVTVTLERKNSVELTSGYIDYSDEYGSFTSYSGFYTGSIGSVSPTTINGKTISYLYDYYNYPYSGSPVGYTVLTLTNTGSDLGIGYFTSVTANGVVNLTSAASYAYSSSGGGTSQWTWTWGGSAYSFDFTNGAVYTVAFA